MTEIKARFTLEDNYSSQIKAAINITDKFRESMLNTSNTLKDKFILEVKTSNDSMDKFQDFTLKAGSSLKDSFLPQVKDATEKIDILSNSILNTLTLLDRLQNKKIQVSIVESITKSETGESAKQTKSNSEKGNEIQLMSMGMVNDKVGTMTVTTPTKEEITGVAEGFKTLVDAATAIKDFKGLFKKDSNNKFENELNNSVHTNKGRGNKTKNQKGNKTRATMNSDKSIGSAIKKYNNAKNGVVTETGEARNKVSKLVSNGDNSKDAVKSADGFKNALTSAKNFGRKFETALQGIGPSLSNVSKKISSFAKSISGTFNIVSGTIKVWVAMIGNVLKLKLGQTIKSAVAGIMKTMKTFFSFLGKNPIILIIAAIIALVALLYEAWKNDWGGIREKTQAVIDFIKPKIESIKDTFTTVQKKVEDFVDGIKKFWQDLMEFFKHPIEGTVNLVKNMSNGTPAPSAKVGAYALGTSYSQGGLTWVGENGPELIDLSAGSKVYNNRESKNMIGNGINVAKLADQIVVREDADIDKIVSKLVSKLTQIQPNMA